MRILLAQQSRFRDIKYQPFPPDIAGFSRSFNSLSFDKASGSIGIGDSRNDESRSINRTANHERTEILLSQRALTNRPPISVDPDAAMSTAASDIDASRLDRCANHASDPSIIINDHKDRRRHQTSRCAEINVRSNRR